jgi:retinol dehydrogenase-12
MVPGSALPIVSTDLTGRTILVTGANTGLGYAAALKFLRMNPARLILAVRAVSKGLEAVRRLADDLGAGAGDGSMPALEEVVQVWECDLANFASVKRFAQKADEELERLDIVVLNAAVATSKWAATADGWESS